MRRTSLQILEDILKILQKRDTRTTEIMKKVKINSRVFAAKMESLVGCGAVVWQDAGRKWTISEKGREVLETISKTNKLLGGGETP